MTIWLWLSMITWFSFHFLYVDYLIIMSSSVITWLPLNFICTDYVMIMSVSVITWLPLKFICTDYLTIMSFSVITWLPLKFICTDCITKLKYCVNTILKKSIVYVHCILFHLFNMSRRVAIYSIVSFVWYVAKGGNLLDCFICLICHEGWQSTRLFHLLDMSRRVAIYSIVLFVWYVAKGGILLTCEKKILSWPHYFNNRIGFVHKTSLTPPLFIKVFAPIQVSERSCTVVSILPLILELFRQIYFHFNV